MTSTEASDEELVRQFHAGDMAAFARFIARHEDRIFRLAAVWLDDPQLAADATQECFLRSFRGLGRFRFRATPFTWLYRTARHVCFEFNRKRRHAPLEQELADDTAGPARQLAELDAARRVRALVANLPARQREVVLLRHFEDLSVAATARAMGCREGTVKALLHKAMARLRRDGARKGLNE